MIGFATGYRIGMWIVGRIPERAVAWLAAKPRVADWARRDGPDG